MSNLVDSIKSAPIGQPHLFYIGQAGFIIKSVSGKLLAVDLYLSDCVARFDHFKRLTPFILAPGEITMDYIIATHAHYDHFDIDSMPALLANGKTKLLASTGCETEVKRLCIDESIVTYVKVGDKADLGDIKAEFVFCDHGESAPDAVGVVLETGGKLIYMAGDTSLRLDMVDKITKGRIFDIMIAPINGTFGNLNGTEAVQLCEKVKPKLFIPCHYGTFVEQYGDLCGFVKAMNERLPAQKFYLMRIGEERYIGDEIINETRKCTGHIICI